ncbi:1-phosphofructokinase [Heyndrickxia sporothermodurans]|uniref:Tagatose-6-phosphate kinase n=2 Tax=Heyndrickxia sporothermodurans TaxID=46224 RepID=A0A150L7E9_9BACI|nr:1-phosphofructokinase [Heyndrickxia sporothermodurans]KYD08233.1 fructose-1-phosphate kinase [Heyndrickxia sporothermodurans]MBL5768909.1 1-phosphofructokinase [Heyndrickxia sporothermodurans]MBL5772062.1 1-phosphofructokinase [Heyndrickxia sporothermodurans]MBL5775652.1 1-phosphofructokinase [Heyndrickxia sporothermodurans]MBL5779201.1 1-phosphofructokinase [Heyndrickxia sporothermodurans]
MIYTITLNPSLDYTVKVDNFQIGELNRSNEDYKVPGGKGINVSRVLKRLGVDSKALGFVGGFTGKYIEDYLKDEQIEVDFVKVAGDSRINIKLKTDVETEINGSGPNIGPAEFEKFIEKLDAANSKDIIVFSGSIPSTLPATIYKDLIEKGKQKGTLFVADVSGVALKNVIEAKPFLIKPNHHELGELFDKEITTIQDAYLYGKKLVDSGIENVIVSMADKGAVLITKTGAYHANVPKGTLVNSVGAGDSLVGGFLAAFVTGAPVEQAFRNGVSSGSATAFSMGLCTKEMVSNLLNQVKVTTL